MKTVNEDAVPQLDLHALTADEAITRVERFLHDAYRHGARQVIVIHGKGTGILKTEVRRYLKTHPLVFRFSEADRCHGGAGATQVIFK